MRLKLKDDPSEWQKFAATAALFLTLVSGLLWRRAWIPDLAVQAILFALATLLVLALIRPVAFRPFYRAAMRFSHAVGQVVGRILLVLCFIFLLTPLALLLRLLGHDLLQLRRPINRQTYWRPARRPSHPDRSF
jgi:hypothetical protein